MRWGWHLAFALVVSRTARAQQSVPLTLVGADAVSCPDRANLEEALRAQGFTPVDAGAAPPFLQVASIAEGLSLELRDGRGEIILYRVLPGGDCTPLATTIALLVDRRMRELAVGDAPGGDHGPRVARGPAPQPPARGPARSPPRPWTLEGRGGLLVGNGIDRTGLGPGPTMGAVVKAPRLLEAQISFGWLPQATVPVSFTNDGSLSMDRFLVTLGAGAGTRGDRFEFSAQGRVEVELLRASSHGLSHTDDGVDPAVRAGPALTLAYRPGSRFWASLQAGVLVLIAGWRLEIGHTPVAEHEKVALEAAACLGYRFEM